MHPAIAALLEHFEFEHLPERLGAVSKRFHDLAHDLVGPPEQGGMGLEGAEAATALRKLLEAKDCAVRAARTGR